MNYLLVGLGNPGKKYVSTRHNAGKMLAAWLGKVQKSTKKYKKVQEGEIEVVETDCFMNQSGEFVKRIVQKGRLSSAKISQHRIADKSDRSDSGISDLSTIRSGPPQAGRADSAETLAFPKLFIAHDDLDLKLGEWKIHFGRGPRLHKGILSIEQALGTKEFWRVRIGIDNRESQLSSAKISKHPPAIAFGDSRWRAGQIADKSAESDSGLSDLIHNPILADASRSKPTFSVSGEEYVLRPFKREEKVILYRAFGSIRDALSRQL